MDRFHTESKATYNCSFESNGTACPFYCYRPEDLLAHEKRHQDPTFKTRKRPLNNSSFPSTSQAKIQQLEPEYTKNEDEKPSDAGKDQHVGEEPQPGEVESNLDSVISPDSVQRLELVPVTKSSPPLVELTALRL